MLFKITDGTVSLGGETILSHIHFEIRDKEKVALIGRNGAGKTTLLRLIAGELPLDRDDKRQGPGLYCSEKITVGILKQSSVEEKEKTVGQLFLDSCPYEEAYSKERYLYEIEQDKIFIKFGFCKEDKNRKIKTFSGGEQTKIFLAHLLLQKPDLLLLDEPTNHLDLAAVEWLEQYLADYEKAVVIVSHDRFFLDRVASVSYELFQGKLTRYAGNYTEYREQKQKDYILMKKRYEHWKKEEERLQELIEKFKRKPKKAAFARSRKSMLQRMQPVEKPREDDAQIYTGTIEPEIISSKWVWESKRLHIGYRQESPLLEVSFRIRRGQKIGILGVNGVGKTTFLKTMAGLLEPLSGSCSYGNRVAMGYFDQQTASISSELTVAEHFKKLYPGLTEKEVYGTLAQYLFKGRDASVCVKDLSGGEKARLVLCELLTARPNLLLLDEPTNHMDIRAKETLESAFRAYKGTMVFISHDRYFIQQVADALLVFEGNAAYYYPFGYSHYIERIHKNGGQEPAALVRAEDEALAAAFQAVPKRERHESRQLSSEEAYVDWKLRLAKEPLEEAEQKVAVLFQRRQEEEENCLEQGILNSPELRQVNKELELAWQQWTQACLAWHEVTLTL